MTISEKIQPKTNGESQPADPEREIPEADIRHMGHAGIVISEHTDFQPISVEIEGIEPAHYAPAGAKPYEGTAKRGLEINGRDQEEAATEYLSSLFPDSEFTFLGDGRYGVVMADQDGKAYKVYRSALSYSRSEKEAGSLKLLSDAGLAPKLHLFVDAGQEYRLDRKAYNYTTFGFEDVQIPRQDSGRELPVIVMDQVDAGPLEDASPEQFVDGFCKTAALFVKENIHSWDLEVMLNKATGEVIILDTGELSQKPLEDPTKPEAKQRNEEEIFRGLCMDFGIRNYFGVWKAYQEGGIEAVREQLTKSS
jgi:hypothetical protein